MQLTTEEKAMLSGERGETIKNAIEQQVHVGEFFGAEKFVPVNNVHMMGDIEVMGEAGLAYLKGMVDAQAQCVSSITTNARCMDFDFVEKLGQDKQAAVQERELISCLKQMNVLTTDTCINYQSVYQPHFGEHVAWGDTGTVIYANSVFGARSNFESGPAALAAALTGRVPAYGFHLDDHRKGTFVVNVDADLNDLADWGALGKLIGEPHQNYFSVPVITGIKKSPTSDELKHLGTSLASYGSMGMFHMVGVTPEAPNVETALGGNTPVDEVTITNADIEGIYDSYNVNSGSCDLVVFSGPQLSLYELKNLAGLLEGKKVSPKTKLFITTNREFKSLSDKLGYTETIEAAGGNIMEGVCFYLLQNLTEIRLRNEWDNLVSNSAKIVNTITAHRFNTILRRTEECVESAISGRIS
jgi:predicted aconitase